MRQRILWVDDDYYLIKGLFRPLEKRGFSVDVAQSASQAIEKAVKGDSYDLMVIDLIIPLGEDEIPFPDFIREWGNHKYIGTELVRWIRLNKLAKCPILIMSEVHDALSLPDLHTLENVMSISKSGLIPSKVEAFVLQIINRENNL